MYHVSICLYLGKYWQVFLRRYVKIDQFVFHKNTYAILTTRFTDVVVEDAGRNPNASSGRQSPRRAGLRDVGAAA
jgi:hypothetical protein